MITGWYQNPETKDWYYLWDNGSMATGWVPVNGRWYYLNAGSGEMAHDVTTPDGYKVNADGAWVDANGKAYDAPNGDQKTTTSKRGSGGSDGSSDSDSDSGSHSSGNNSSNSGNSENGGNNGSNSGNNGTASDNGSNSGNNGNTGDNETPEEKTLVVESQTKLVDLGWSQYVTVAFAKGYSLDDCTLTVDGVDVTDAFTKVDKDGTIVKWEITSLNPAKLAVTGKDGETQIVKLSNNTDPETPEVRTATAPKTFLAHGSVYVWDYHLDNYDEDGNIRYIPKETTFDLGEEKGGIRYYAPAAELTEDESNLYGVGGKAVVMFNYTEETDKQWFDQITNVALVSGNGYNNTINSNLKYDKTTGEHYGNTVGQIIVPLGQSNFYSNGSYYLRITSGGKNTLIPIEVVNGTAPSMALNEAAAITSGKNIHFKVSNMTYGIEIPVSRVELTDPDGKTTELEKIRDWYLIGDTFILYNDVTAENGRNNIPKAGNYTVKVHSTGFKDMTYTFSVVDGTAAQNKVVAEDIYGIDAMSSASISGGSVSGSGDASGGGSTTMSADLLFDADLLTNALLLQKIGVENEYANAIADRWTYDMSGYDAVIGEDGETFYPFTGYRDAVEKAKVDGKYLSFAEYIESENAVTTQNRPYATKYVLEDNRLGGTMMSGSYLGKTVPKFVLVDKEGNAVNEIPEGQDVRIVCDDTEYLQKIVDSGEIYMNGITYQAVNKNKYWLGEVGEKQVLVLDSSLFGVDKDNKVTIKVDKYQDKIFNVAIAKDVKAVELTVGEDLETGKEVTITNTADETGDIWKNIQSVVLVRPDRTTKNLLPDGYEDVHKEIGYTINDDTLTLGKDLFDVAGEYSVKISAKYYGMKTVTFTVEQAEDNNGGDNSGEELVPPTVTSTEKNTFGGSYTITVGMNQDDWMNAITGITVNGTDYPKKAFADDGYSLAVTDGRITLGKEKFTEEKNTVVIKAEGYKDLTIVLDQNGKEVTGDSDGNKDTETEAKEAPTVTDVSKASYDGKYTISVGMNHDDWMNAINEVTVNGTAYRKGAFYDDGYSLGVTDGRITLGKEKFTEEKNTVVIKAEGYKDLTIVLNQNGKKVKNLLIEKKTSSMAEIANVLPSGENQTSEDEKTEIIDETDVPSDKENSDIDDSDTIIADFDEDIAVDDASDDEIVNDDEEIIEDTETEESTEIEKSEDIVEIEEDASVEFVLDETPEQ